MLLELGDFLSQAHTYKTIRSILEDYLQTDEGRNQLLPGGGVKLVK